MKAFLSMAVVALAAGLALAPPASAQAPPGGRVTPMFKALDADGDGKITLAEFLRGSRGEGTASEPDSPKHLETRFRQLDGDGDGALSPGELIGTGRRAAHAQH